MNIYLTLFGKKTKFSVTTGYVETHPRADGTQDKWVKRHFSNRNLDLLHTEDLKEIKWGIVDNHFKASNGLPKINKAVLQKEFERQVLKNISMAKRSVEVLKKTYQRKMTATKKKINFLKAFASA